VIRLHKPLHIQAPTCGLLSSKVRMTDRIELGGRLLVIFDGHCGFCNKSIRWFLRRDRNDRLRFVASESPIVADLLARHGFASSDLESGPDTMLAVRGAGGQDHPGGQVEQVMARSDAAVAMLRVLPRPWPAVGRVFSWIPRPVRDLGYRLMARWRYRIWGRLEACPLATPEEREHFL
jgi:predicted DCC family thiol-disulfide oxidoreductase YuxK